jgi:hypothetical protein
MTKSRPSRSRPPRSTPPKRSPSGRRDPAPSKQQGSSAPQKGQRPPSGGQSAPHEPRRPQQQPRGRSSSEPKLQPRPSRNAPAPLPQKHAPRETSPPLPHGTHWRETLGPLLTQSSYQPLGEEELMRKLHIPPAEKQSFLSFLAEQELTGRTMRDPRGRLVSPKKLGFSVGHLQMNERGFGFLVSSDPSEPDFYIAGDDTANALHGDLVVARLKQRGQRDSRLRGEVVRLLQRKRHALQDAAILLRTAGRNPHSLRHPGAGAEGSLHAGA